MQLQQRIFQGLFVGSVMGSNQLRFISGEVNQNGINTVQAGAGHQACIHLGIVEHSLWSYQLVKSGQINVMQQTQARNQTAGCFLESGHLQFNYRGGIRQCNT